jgi:hypothetical protein
MKDIIILKHNNKICGYYSKKSAVDTFVNSCINCKFIKETDKIELEYYETNSFILKKTEQYNNKNDVRIKEKTIKINKNMYEDFSDSDTTSVDFENVSSSSSDSNKILLLDNDTDSEKSLILNEDNKSEDLFTLDAEAFLQKKKDQRIQQQKIIELGQQKIDIMSQINKLKLDKKKMEEKKTKFDYDLELYKKFKKMKEKDFSFDVPVMFKNIYDLFEKLDNNNDLSFESFIENYVEEKILTQYDDMFSVEPYAYKLPVPEDFKSDNIDTLMSAAF